MLTPENYFTIISVINDVYIYIFYVVFNSIANLIIITISKFQIFSRYIKFKINYYLLVFYIV